MTWLAVGLTEGFLFLEALIFLSSFLLKMILVLWFMLPPVWYEAN
jgi:hypothetical protein